MTIRYINTFTNLIQHKESEVVEFKKAENNFDFDDLGKYFSAMSNEANLRGLDFAWLIFGYDEKCLKIDAVIEKINTQIERLKELRRSLINEGGTGELAI
jgi:putative transcriptional regulator